MVYYKLLNIALYSTYISSDRLNLKLNCQLQTPSGISPSLLKKDNPIWIIFSKSTLHLNKHNSQYINC